jgi:hypothetical protein
MSVNQLIARGGTPVDTSGTRGEIAHLQQRNALMQREDEEDAQFDAALKAGDFDTAMRIDPQTTQLYMAHKQRERMSGLGDIPITAKRLDEAPIQAQYNADRQFAATQRNSDRSYQLQMAQERRLSKQGGGDDEFARYQAMTDDQRKLYDKMKGRNGAAGGVTVNEDGTFTVNPDPSKATEGERTATNYADRMEASEPKLGTYIPSTKDYAAASVVMSRGPLLASAANKALSKEGQIYYQAVNDWVRAKLRKESGAAIPPEEMAQEIKTYFPLPGDESNPEVVAQKAAARAQATAGMRQMGGRGASSLPSRPGQSAPSQNKRVKFGDL